MNPSTHPHEFIKHTDPDYVIQPGDLYVSAFCSGAYYAFGESVGRTLRDAEFSAAWSPRPVPAYDKSKYDYVSDPSYVIQDGDLIYFGDECGDDWVPVTGSKGRTLAWLNEGLVDRPGNVYGVLTPKNVEIKPRFFRHSDGLFDGGYCIEVLGDRSTFVYLDGRRDPDDGVIFQWTLERCLDMVSKKLWVEFDGNLEPFRPREDEPAPSTLTTIEGWLKALPAGYRERALKNLDPDVRNAERRSAEEAVRGAFVWSRTPEGLDFWVAVKNHLLGSGDLPALPDEAAELRRTLERRNATLACLSDQNAALRTALRKIQLAADAAVR